MAELHNHSERAHALLSASSAHRWLACPPSAMVALLYPQQDTEFTREGTLAHEVAEAVARGKEVPPDKSSEEWVTAEMIECAVGYADYIQEQIKSDDAVVLLEQRVDFSPWVPDGFGTCDCIIIQGETLTIIDYKYGQGVAVSAKDNPQMKLYALGALNDYGIAYDVKNIEMHIYQPRINNISVDGLTTAALVLWAEETVAPIAELAAKGQGEYTAGEHCRFCPHAGRCPTMRNTYLEFVEAHGLNVAVPVLSEYELADTLQMIPMIEVWLKRIKAQALTTLLDGGSVPGYKVVEGRPGNRKWTDELKALEALQAAGYQAEDVTETKLLSPASMDKVIGKKKVVEILSGHISQSPGAPTVVVESDKRPVYDRVAEAVKDFE